MLCRNREIETLEVRIHKQKKKIQTEYYNVHRQALILSVSSDSPPGFTLLQLLSPWADSRVISALVIINISSSKYREITCSIIRPNSTVHGPCGSGVIAGIEYDDAHCFVCDFWPPSASSWIDGCHTWPQVDSNDWL
jgi:hypothetical protein